MRFYVVQLTCDWACKDRQPIRANHAPRPRAYSCKQKIFLLPQTVLATRHRIPDADRRIFAPQRACKTGL